MTASSERLTSAERRDLTSLIRRRSKVAKTATEAVKAERLAVFEEQLASEFSAEDERFRDLTEFARQMVERANEELQRRCTEMQIPAQFRPRMTLNWVGRWENAVGERRAELRRVAQVRADADQKAAIERIEAASVDAEEAVLRESLTTDTARELLDRLPRPEQLLPALDTSSVLKALPGHRFDGPMSERYRSSYRLDWRADAAALEEVLQQRLGSEQQGPTFAERGLTVRELLDGDDD